MRALIVFAFWSIPASAAPATFSQVVLVEQTSPTATLSLEVSEVQETRAKLKISITNRTDRAITVVPSAMPWGGAWWSPWLSITVRKMQDATSRGSFAGYPDDFKMPCTTPPPVGMAPAEKVVVPAQGSTVIREEFFPFSKGDGVFILQAVYQVADRAPSCSSFAAAWSQATKVSLTSNFVVLHHSE